ncbi:MAG: sigma-E processing peptidase SpoIIGA [Limnochordales bacterium]
MGGGAGTVIWMDALMLQAVAALIFDYMLLWATAEVARAPASAGRLAAAALLGAGYFVAHTLAGAGVLPGYGHLRLVPVVFLVSAAMLVVAFGARPVRRLLAIGAHFYGIGFVAAGAGTAASFLFGSGGAPDSVAGFLAAGGAILAVAELGWGVLQRRIWQQLYQLPLEIELGGRCRRMMALVDTGNRLRDPLTGRPVVVVEQETLADLLPGDVRPAVERMESGDLSAVERLLASERWSARFRVIPFSSIGRRHGLLIGFRPDAVRLVWEGRPTPAGDCILAVCKGPLDPDGSYRALVHPDLLRTVLAGDAREEPAAQYFSRRPRTGDAPSHY